jgi:hypothetical protein
MAGLRGIYVLDAWSPYPLSGKPEQDEDLRIDLEWWEKEETGSWQFAELVKAGQLHFIGKMPTIPGYDPGSPSTAKKQSAASAAE